MLPTSTGVRLAAGVIAAAAATALAPPTPGSADQQTTTGPVLVRAESQRDQAPLKTATASCPDGLVALGAGGQVVAGGGRVILSAVVPDPALTSVTAQAVALPGSAGGDWSVAAVAVCVGGVYYYGRSRSGPGSATASCPSYTPDLTGTGFVLPRSGEALLTGVVPEPGQVTVTVQQRGPVPVTPTAYAICAAASSHDRHAATSKSGPDRSHAVLVGSPAPAVTGVGGLVTGKVLDVFIDTLVPLGLQLARVRARQLATTGGGQAFQLASGALQLASGEEEESWSLTGYAVETADYY